MISGHRRLRACELAGIREIPVIVRKLTDDEAMILMVDSNLQRECILPSERAAAYKMKLVALKHQGQRKDLSDEVTSAQVGPKSWAAEKSHKKPVTANLRSRDLSVSPSFFPELQEKVDSKEIAFNPAGALVSQARRTEAIRRYGLFPARRRPCLRRSGSRSSVRPARIERHVCGHVGGKEG